MRPASHARLAIGLEGLRWLALEVQRKHFRHGSNPHVQLGSQALDQNVGYKGLATDHLIEEVHALAQANRMRKLACSRAPALLQSRLCDLDGRGVAFNGVEHRAAGRVEQLRFEWQRLARVLGVSQVHQCRIGDLHNVSRMGKRQCLPLLRRGLWVGRQKFLNQCRGFVAGRALFIHASLHFAAPRALISHACEQCSLRAS